MTSTTIGDVDSKLAIATEALRRAEERATAVQPALEVMPRSKIHCRPCSTWRI